MKTKYEYERAFRDAQSVNNIIKKVQNPKDFMEALLDNRLFFNESNTLWMKRVYGLDEEYPWKLHLFADSKADWHELSKAILPFLIKNNVDFKTVNQKKSAEDIFLRNGEPQFGKAFTIYPNNQQEFEMIVRELDIEITKAELSKVAGLDGNVHNMAYEKNLGDTGRIFYRAGNHPDNGGYIDAETSKKINPENPYNPFDIPDPFKKIDFNGDYKKLRMMTDIEPKPMIDDMGNIYDMNYCFNPTRVEFIKEPGKSYTIERRSDFEEIKNLLTKMGIKFEIEGSVNFIVKASDLKEYFNKNKKEKFHAGNKKLEEPGDAIGVIYNIVNSKSSCKQCG